MADIVKFEAGKISADMFATANESFKESKPEIPSGGGFNILSMDRKGIWTVGQDSKRVPDDSLWSAYPQSFASGYISWDGLAFEAKVMASIGEPPVDPSTLPPAADEWQPNVGVVFVCVECKTDPDLEGTVAVYEQCSKGGVEAWTKLYDSTVARAKAGNADFAPCVVLANTYWIAKKGENKGGKVFKPKFQIESWDDPNDLASDFGNPPMIQSAGLDEAEDKQVQPASRRRIETSKVEDAEVVDEQPAPRRRRRTED